MMVEHFALLETETRRRRGDPFAPVLDPKGPYGAGVIAAAAEAAARAFADADPANQVQSQGCLRGLSDARGTRAPTTSA